MADMSIPPQYAWLFVGALYWRVTLAVIATFAVAGALLRQHRARVLCFVIARLLSADVLLLFLMPDRTD